MIGNFNHMNDIEEETIYQALSVQINLNMCKIYFVFLDYCEAGVYSQKI